MAYALELIEPKKIDKVAVFTGPTGIDKILKDIETKVLAQVPDTTTASGRKDIASLAYKVSQSKTVLDELGKSLTAEWKEKSKKVDLSRKTARDFLDTLRDKARFPLTQWEEEEEAKRIAKEEEKYDESPLRSLPSNMPLIGPRPTPRRT